MSRPKTINDVFEIAIQAETAAEELYRRLALMFSHCPDVASFWDKYANEEAGHRYWLARLKKDTPPEKLSEQASSSVLEDVTRMLEFGVDQALWNVRDLEDAYRLADELENSETNAIFDFLISNFATDSQIGPFLHKQLQGHINRLHDSFPSSYCAADQRRKVAVSG